MGAELRQTKLAEQPATPGSGSDPDGDTAVLGEAQPLARIGTSVAAPIAGRYAVLEEIGRGGMGRVLRAYDPKLQREVALKEVRRNMLGLEEAQRLVREARAMAKLSHPNVVAVYDVEELEMSPPRSDGPTRVVLVMEYVPGQTLRSWLAQHQHDWRDIVRCFLAAGRGLAAAHAAGLLHRDFKPANVLVGEGGVVKVTDFGLAKLQQSASQSASGEDGRVAASQDQSKGPQSGSLTEAGSVLGTPRYMAPEQHRGDPLSDAADQYALCVALWQALCGAPPFSGSDLYAQKERGPPAWPDAERSVPVAIVESIRRGLAPDPTERWPSLDALLAALQHDPAERRRRIALGIGGAVALLAGITGWQSFAAARARQCSGAQAHLDDVWGSARREAVRAAVLGVEVPYASEVWEQSAEALDAYTTHWAREHAQACEATNVRAEQSSAVLDLRMTCLHRAKEDVRAVTEVLLDADADVLAEAHRLIAGLRPIQRCGDVEALQANVEPPLPRDTAAVEAIRAKLAASKASANAGRYAEAQRLVNAAEHMLSQVDYAPARTEVALEQARVLEHLGQLDEAEHALREALHIASRWRQWEQMGAAATHLMGILGSGQQRLDEALSFRDFAMGLAEDDPLALAAVHNNTGLIYELQGKHAQAVFEHETALALREENLEATHPTIAESRSNLAAALMGQGKHEEALAENRAVLELRVAALGSNHPKVASTHNNLAIALASQGKLPEAEEQIRKAIELREATLGPAHAEVGGARSNLAAMLRLQGKYEQSEQEGRRALKIQSEALGSDHPDVGMTRDGLAATLMRLGRYEDAEEQFRLAIDQFAKSLGPDHYRVSQCRGNLAGLLYHQRKFVQAEPELRAALEGQARELGDGHPFVDSTRTKLAAVLLELGKPDEARTLAEQAWSRFEQGDIPPMERGQTAFILARALRETGERSKARELGEEALASYTRAQETGSVEEGELDKVRAWLAAP